MSCHFRNRIGGHWSFLDLQRILCNTGNRATQQCITLSTAIRFNSTRSTRGPEHARDASERPPRHTRTFNEKDSASHSSSGTIQSSSQRIQYQANTRNGSAKQSKYNTGGKSFRKPMPWNFRAIPDTERIEGMEKQAAQEFFSKHIGVSTVSNDAFSIKACRMPFREPKPREVPPFVQKAILEYEYATLRYSQDLLEYEQFRQAQSRQDEKQESTLIPKPIPPTKPLFVIQHELRNVREYPDSVDAPHPAFRVTFILSKKQISKLAIHRNFVRKKLAAAAEMVFRGHARQGYEFMVFAKKPSMTTPQGKLVELMKEALTNPFLYGERLSQRSDSGKNSNGSNSNSNSNNSTTMQDINDNIQESLTATAATAASAAAAASNPHVVTVRWKNNRPSAHRLWWKRAIPNPLGRVQQTDEYLDRFCPKVELTRSSSKTSISTSEQKNIKTAKKADSKANETR